MEASRRATAPATAFRWNVREVAEPDAVSALARSLNDLPDSLARALYLRGVTTFEAARHFFRPSVVTLHDPFLMKDMDRAARRLAAAVGSNERILVYGDYDVDGVTSTALMLRFLRGLGVEASFFIPDRLVHGYGLSAAGIDEAVSRQVNVVVALDCGIGAIDVARYARTKGVDLIICDHHTAGVELPDAVAVLNPKRSDCGYPYKELSGCGVGFKLCQAVSSELGVDHAVVLDLLDLVAVSIASDIVPIDGENRVLMTEGLTRLRASPKAGLLELARAARLSLSDCTTTDVVFGLAPRINAAGRLADAGAAVELLVTEDPAVAKRRAREIETLNEQRRALDKDTLARAEEAARRMLESRTRSGIVLYDPAWHAGVIGITASRIVERFFRPTVMLTRVGEVVKGSARSVDGINVFQVLKACSDLLLGFGGHDYAAGVQLTEENVPAFRDRFDAAASEFTTAETLVPALHIDAAVRLADIDGRFWAVLRQFEPFGPANPKPVFMHRELEVVGRPTTVGSDQTHLRFSVREIGGGRAMPAIGFGLGAQIGRIRESQRAGLPLEMAFSVDENTYRGNRSIQLKARDIRISSQP